MTSIFLGSTPSSAVTQSPVSLSKMETSPRFSTSAATPTPLTTKSPSRTMTTILMSTRQLTTRPMTETTPTTPAEVKTSHSHSTTAATSTLYVDFSSTPYLLFSTTHVPISTPRRSLPTTPESTTSSRSRTTRLVSTQAVSTGQVSTGQIPTGQISVEVTTSPTGEMPVEVIISSTGEVSVEVTTTSTHFTTSLTTPLPPMYSMPMMTNYLRFSTQESGQRRMIRDRRPAFTTRGKPRNKQYRI